jgi:hypothetical protein
MLCTTISSLRSAHLIVHPERRRRHSPTVPPVDANSNPSNFEFGLHVKARPFGDSERFQESRAFMASAAGVSSGSLAPQWENLQRLVYWEQVLSTRTTSQTPTFQLRSLSWRVGADKVGVLRMSGDGLGEHSKSTEVLRKMSGVNSL